MFERYANELTQANTAPEMIKVENIKSIPDMTLNIEFAQLKIIYGASQH